MQTEKTKGIVLKSIPYKDSQCIITVFSQNLGLVSMIVKGLSKKRPLLNSSIELLCEAEFVYVKGNSDLLKFQDSSILDLHLSLREKYSHLRTAMQMTQCLLQSQMPEKASPLLYALFSSFLKQIPHFNSPTTLLCSFYLKLLRHEGFLNLLSFPDSEDIFFHNEEQLLIQKLCLIQSFQELKEHAASENLLGKIENLFLQKTKMN